MPDPETRSRLTRKRLLGLDRSGPEPVQTRAGQPLRPFTLPNLIGYIRLLGIPVYLVIAFNSGDGVPTNCPDIRLVTSRSVVLRSRAFWDA